MDVPENTPQVIVAPRCPICGSGRSTSQRSQAIPGGLMYDGEQCYAVKQYRRCSSCQANFPAILIKDRLRESRKRRATGPWSQ